MSPAGGGKKRDGRLKLSPQNLLALFLLYLALCFIRHNGIVYLFFVPFFLVVLKILPFRCVFMTLLAFCAVSAALLWALQSKISVEDAGYLFNRGVRLVKPVLMRPVGHEAVRVSREYWGVLNINQTRSKWDLWHYFLGDRQAY